MYRFGLINEEGYKIIRQTINEKIDIDEEENEKVDAYPLHIAVEKSNLMAAQWLLRNGADINARDNMGFTPFSGSVYNQDYEMAKFLSESGADVNLKSFQEMPPLHFLVDYNQAENSATNDNQEEQKQNAQTTPIWRKMLNVFIDNPSTDFNATGIDGSTILHIVKEPELATALLEITNENGERKININKRRKMDGCTALHCAIVEGNTAVASVLISHRTNLQIINHDNVPPMIFAALHPNTVSLLDQVLSSRPTEKKRPKKQKFIKAARAIQALRMTFSPFNFASSPDFLQEALHLAVSKNLPNTNDREVL